MLIVNYIYKNDDDNDNIKNNNKNDYKYELLKRFPAHDELGTCRASLVSPEQPVVCMPILDLLVQQF